ncbi:MAG: hypothetical protein AB4372_01515 [Xenococcus sp. (in: cyanobacteria)]
MFAPLVNLLGTPKAQTTKAEPSDSQEIATFLSKALALELDLEYTWEEGKVIYKVTTLDRSCSVFLYLEDNISFYHNLQGYLTKISSPLALYMLSAIENQDTKDSIYYLKESEGNNYEFTAEESPLRVTKAEKEGCTVWAFPLVGNIYPRQKNMSGGTPVILQKSRFTLGEPGKIVVRTVPTSLFCGYVPPPLVPYFQGKNTKAVTLSSKDDTGFLIMAIVYD